MKTKMTRAQRMAQYVDATFNFYETAGHGYLFVPKQLILDLGLEFFISPFSYETLVDKKKWVYLEEDCDTGVFVKAYKAYFGKEATINWVEALDDDGFIIHNYRFGSQLGQEVYMFRMMSGLNNLDEVEKKLVRLSQTHKKSLAV